MKVRELIAELNKIENKERELQILIGDEDNDSLGCEIFELMTLTTYNVVANGTSHDELVITNKNK